jgi:hypothetical protein
MRKTLLFLMLISVKLTFAQVSEDFSDGNYTINPTWIGNNSLFNVNSFKQLQSSLNANAQMVSLSTSSFLALNTRWEFFVKLNFDPSTSNQARIYLIADNQDLNAALNGYFVQIGESGSADSYDLYKQTGLTTIKIIDGAAKNREDVNILLARIKVTRSDVGKWELATDITGGNNFVFEGSAIDLTHATSDWFGVRCEYIASRSTGFVFDDFIVDELTPDVTPPLLVSAKVLDEFNVEAVFSERLQSSALVASNYGVSNLGMPTTITAISSNSYKLTFNLALPTGEYKLTVNNVKDLKGNQITTNNTTTFFYVKPYTLKKGDILISEVLSNPRAGGVDFVEIYNNTNQILDLKELQLANADVSGNAANIKNLSATSIYMAAKTYWVLTTNPTIIKQQYDAKFSNQFIQMSSFPSYNNDKGSVILLGKIGLLEQFDYNENMHIALLKDADGVSLERVSFIKEANLTGNFKSAAQSCGFATPTYKNSQELDADLTKNKVSLISKTFSPDGDGFEDLLQINYSFIENGNFATVNIYSDNGVLIRKLERNTSIATAGNFIWDGLNDAGQQSKVGIYIIKFDAFALNGKTESFKQTCVLAAKL